VQKRLIQLTEHSWALIVPKYFVRKYELDTKPKLIEIQDLDSGTLLLRLKNDSE
jgi:hypothetical protein